MRIRHLSDHDLTQAVIDGIVEAMLAADAEVHLGRRWGAMARELLRRHGRRLPECVCEDCWLPPADDC